LPSKEVDKNHEYLESYLSVIASGTWVAQEHIYCFSNIHAHTPGFLLRKYGSVLYIDFDKLFL